MWSVIVGLIPKSLKTPLAGAIGIALVIGGFYLWHRSIVSNAEDARDDWWEAALIAGIDSVKKTVTVEEKPQPPIEAEIHEGKVITSQEVEARIDSAWQVWELTQADKDSLLRFYTRPREYRDTTTYTVIDTVTEEKDGVTTVRVLTRSYRLPVKMSFDPLQDKANLLAEIPPIYIRTEKIEHTKYVPFPVKWYESGTAHYVYGVATVGAIYGIVRAVTKH